MEVKHVRKWLSTFMSLMMMGTFLIGCSDGETYQSYKEASIRTGEIKRGAQTITIKAEQEPQAASQSNSADNWINALETVKLRLSGHFDKKADQAIYNLYYYYDDLGTDFQYYRQSREMQYIKLAIFPEYLKLDGESSGEVDEGEIIAEILDSTSEKWHQIIRAENVFVGEKVTIKNQDGDVKATKYTVKPTANQLEDIKKEVEEQIGSKREVLKIAIEKVLKNAEVQGVNSDEILNVMEKMMAQMQITQYEEVAYVDLDGYIVEKNILIGIEYEGDDMPFKAQEININLKNWEIEKKQFFDFPKIDETNSKSIEEVR